MEIYKSIYKIIKLTPLNLTEKTRTRINCKVITTDFFNVGDIVEIVDLKKRERTTEIKIGSMGKSTIIANSVFTENANRYAVLQKIDKGTSDLLTKEAVEYADNYSKYNYIISKNDFSVIVLLSIIQDEFMESFKHTQQKKLF